MSISISLLIDYCKICAEIIIFFSFYKIFPRNAEFLNGNFQLENLFEIKAIALVYSQLRNSRYIVRAAEFISNTLRSFSHVSSMNIADSNRCSANFAKFGFCTHIKNEMRLRD